VRSKADKIASLVLLRLQNYRNKNFKIY